MLSEFCDNVLAESVRVYPPKRYVLLCGGAVSDIHASSPRSLRDAFLQGKGIESVKTSEILQIEEIQEFFDKDSPYDDLVEFEKDIAQVCELVLLFSESPGSFAELGAFSLIEEISEKVLVVIQNKHLSGSSFINKGPIASLKKRYPSSVFSLVESRYGITPQSLAGTNCNLLVQSLAGPIETRLKQAESRTRFDSSKFNHICKLYVGLLREFYSLKEDEIILLLAEFGCHIDEAKLNKLAFCCKAVRWSSYTTAGFDKIHFALPKNNEATKLEFKLPYSDKIRRRNDFRQYWEKHDPDRVAAVDQELS
jgi:hypothetical protein